MTRTTHCARNRMKRHGFPCPLAVLGIVTVAAVAAAQDRGQTGVALQKSDGELAISVDGQPFATYVWNDPRTTRAYFKQVFAPGGEVQLTRHHPPQAGDFSDHDTFHPGIWWGFGDVGGNDYWRMKARIIGGDFIELPQGGKDRGRFAVRNLMLTNDGKETFCEQTCRYTILRWPHGILLICESTFLRKQGDFWLGDQEEMGIATRVATPIAVASERGGVIRDSQGRTELSAIRTHQSDWCDYSGPISGRYGGILIMNDPQNFRKPWWHAVDTGLLVANPLGESELNGRGKRRQNVLVKQGQPFRLRYGVLVHLHKQQQEFDAAQEYRDFLQTLEAIPQPGKPVASAETNLP